MNSALKPVLPQAGAQPAGQASPAKGNVANANHAVGLPQGAQNSLHHGSNNLVGQNLTHHAPAAPQIPPHPVPSMAPVSANMAQMAQNMSHHGNLSHVTQNSVAPPIIAASPNKSATTSAPLSLVQDKPSGPPVPPQPLALTRTPEKKEPDSTGQSNGTVELPKSASNAPAAFKPQNPEPIKEKQDIAKTSPSTPKPPEKPVNAPSTPQKAEPVTSSAKPESSAQPKMATANEAPEKSPAKPSEPKPTPAVAADVAPTQSDKKPAPESANNNKVQEAAAIPAKPEPTPVETAKTENVVKPPQVAAPPVATPQVAAPQVAAPQVAAPQVAAPQVATPQKQEVPADKPAPAPAPISVEEKKEEIKVAKPEIPKKVEAGQPQEKVQKVEEKKQEEKKPEPKPAVAAKEPRVAPKSTLKLATVTTPMRKRRQPSPKANEGPSPAKNLAEGDSTPDSRTKRNRTQVQPYQSPTPELTMATKLSASVGRARASPTKQNDDKLIVFYKNEYLAVRNAEGGFYVCQAMQNVYRATRKIKIRWLSQDKSADPSGVTYKPDFYDVTDMECVLTTLSLTKAPAGGGSQILSKLEEARARSILQRALKAEEGGDIELTEEHPDGLDLSLYKDESQLEKKSRKRGAKASPRKSDAAEEAAEVATPAKRARATPKRSPPTARKAPPPPQTPPPKQNNNKRKPAGSKPTVASTSKTATAVTEKAKPKSTPPPPKRTPVKSNEKGTPVTPVTPVAVITPRAGRRSVAAAKDSKPSPAPSPAPTPSTSSGKTSRRKPPQRK